MKRFLPIVALLLVAPSLAWAQAALGVGGIGGSTLAQWLYNSFAGPALQAASRGVIGIVLTKVGPFFGPVTALIVFMLAKRATFGAVSIDEVLSRAIRLMIITVLAQPAVFNARITQTVLDTIPTQIASTGSGAPAKSVAEGFDGEYNAVDNFSAKLRAQAVGWYYMIERGIIWIAGGCAKFFITLNLFVFICAVAAAAFMLPMVALLLPFMAFDATSDWTMGAIGKLLALFLVMAASTWLGAFVTKQLADYMGQYLQLVQAAAPQDSFKMNAGDSIFSSLGIIGEGIGLPPTDQTQVGNPTTSANITAGIVALWNLVCVCAFGAFIQGIMVVMALSVAGRSGFSLRGPVSVVTGATRMAIRRMGK